MHIDNRHHRDLNAGPEAVGVLLTGLASRNDRLWPHENWPRMRFDGPLAVGAAGGHGPIRYTVEECETGKRIRFRFTGPAGFHGYHELVVEPRGAGTTRLAHRLVMTASGSARLSWPLVFRPLHDALLEDALHKAALALGQTEPPPVWSPWVRLLRRLSGGSMRQRAYSNR